MCENQKPVRQGDISLFSIPNMRKMVCTGLGIGLIALIGTAGADEAARHFRIPAQSLDSSLLRLAADSGLEILFTADQVRGVTGNSLDGSMTPAKALSRLLQGSGMTYRFVDAKTVTIEQLPGHTVKTPNPQSATTLPPVNVVADAVYDETDPYNPSYVQPDATTGTRTDTPIMLTPLNVQVITQQVIRLDQALRNVSGVITNRVSSTDDFEPNAGSGTGITIRGFASPTTLRNGFRLQGGANRNMSNVESIEVLKGPAAILYGLVEPGGIVNVLTKQPLATPYYALNQQFGSYDFYRSTLMRLVL
jgi:iron complex outermembrane recepter protein